MDAAVVPLPEKIATDLDAFALDDGQVPKAPDMAYYLTAFPAHRTEVDTQDEEIWVTPIARVFAEADETVPTNTHCFQKALTRPAGRREWWADLGADVARNIRAP